MAATLLVFFWLGVVLFVLWAAMGSFHRASVNGSLERFHSADPSAFRNLLSREDDHFLQGSLSASGYRKARRARVRAVQDYLMRMAEDCSLMMEMLRLRNTSMPSFAEMLVRQAIRIRLICLGFWSLLWAEWIFPRLELDPVRVLRAYEEFRRKAEASVRQANQEIPLLPIPRGD